ncbi:hypothetical protein niasHT_015958 [Heterodera trifolii]|uniref:Uncharacterized protein n=1 Tax=Heterodera trifolii TaxID=157864 RepID=A0ABD2LBD8_9BILA
MGLCQSEEEKKQVKMSKQIDKRIRETQENEDKTIKLLLLGAGECGKSTLMKQMRILHSDGFSEEELLQQRSVVYSNTVHAMEELLRGMNMYKIGFTEPKGTECARVVMETIRNGEESEPFSDELAAAMKRLWADTALNTATYSRRLEFHLHDSAKHFLDSLDRISNPSYRPSQQDILLTRIKTTGIVEIQFLIKGVPFRVFDVGGQRSERKKWIHCFEDVNSVIFVAAISEYDQVLFEDETTNRMIESMRLFESICNSRWFINTSIILFMNKKDLFAEKIKFISIRTCFKEYDGPQTYDDSIAYIRSKYEALNANLRKTIYVHQTCATDTDQCEGHNLTICGLQNLQIAFIPAKIGSNSFVHFFFCSSFRYSQFVHFSSSSKIMPNSPPPIFSPHFLPKFCQYSLVVFALLFVLIDSHRLQGIGVRGRLLCGKMPLVGAKVKIVDLDPRPDRDDLMGETMTDENGSFGVSGATKEAGDIEVVLKIYHDCMDEHKPCQRRTLWRLPSSYYNNGTLSDWFEVGIVNMELHFPLEERDCRH